MGDSGQFQAFLYALILLHSTASARCLTVQHGLSRFISVTIPNVSKGDANWFYHCFREEDLAFLWLELYTKGLEVLASKHPSYSTPTTALTQHFWLVAAGYTRSWPGYQSHRIGHWCLKTTKVGHQSSINDAWFHFWSTVEDFWGHVQVNQDSVL